MHQRFCKLQTKYRMNEQEKQWTKNKASKSIQDIPCKDQENKLIAQLYLISTDQ